MLGFSGEPTEKQYLDKASQALMQKEFHKSIGFVFAAFSFGNLAKNLINQWVKSAFEADPKVKYVFDKPNTPLVDDNSYKTLKILLESICPFKHGPLFIRYKGMRKISQEWHDDFPVLSKYLDFAYSQLYMTEAPKAAWDCLKMIVKFFLNEVALEKVESRIYELTDPKNLMWLRLLLDFFDDEKLQCEKSHDVKQALNKAFNDDNSQEDNYSSGKRSNNYMVPK